MNELTHASAGELARRIRDREVSPIEVVESHIQGIERLNPRLNLVVTRMDDLARDAARAAERALRDGATLGPLHGVPFSINDAFDTAGVRTTAGSRIAADRVPARDAIVVERMKASGAIPLAKTNLPEFGLNYDCSSPLFGESCNPFDEARTPGGSCGGEAGLVAARLSPLGLGKDAGGSVRVPSHFCGVFGLMPTPGLIPLPGLYPDTMRQYAVSGLMARTARDLELGLRVMSGYDARDPLTVDAPPGDPGTVDVRTLKVAVGNPGATQVARVVWERVEAAGAALASAGLDVEAADPPLREEVQPVFWPILLLEGAYYADSSIPDDRWDDVDPEWLERREFMRSVDINSREHVEARFRRMLMQADGRQWLERYPILLAPCFVTPAFLRGERELDVDGEQINILDGGSASTWANFMAVPSAVVPAGLTSSGLPVGVQVIGRPYCDHEVLAVANLLEQALGGSPVPPLAA